MRTLRRSRRFLYSMLTGWLLPNLTEHAYPVMTVPPEYVQAPERRYPEADQVDAASTHSPPVPSILRARMPLLRLVDAQCPLCSGIGCTDCAHSGLR